MVMCDVHACMYVSVCLCLVLSQSLCLAANGVSRTSVAASYVTQLLQRTVEEVGYIANTHTHTHTHTHAHHSRFTTYLTLQSAHTRNPLFTALRCDEQLCLCMCVLCLALGGCSVQSQRPRLSGCQG